MAYIGHGAIAVVGYALDHDSRAVRPVAFQGEFFKGRGVFIFACTAFDGAFDAVLRHIAGARFFDRQRQTKVTAGVAPARTRSHHNLTCDARKNLPALGVCRALFAANCCPVTMSGHKSFSFTIPFSRE